MAFLKQGMLRQLRELPDQPLLIHPPRSRLLAALAGRWLLLAFAVFLSSGFFIMIAVPLYVCFFYLYFFLTRHWTIYRYSAILLHVLTVLVFVGLLFGLIPLRYALLQSIM